MTRPPALDGGGLPASGEAPAVRRVWWESGARRPGAAEIRADLPVALRLAGALALTGVPAGLLWWWLAPRAQYDVVENGAVAVGHPSPELLAADDAVYTLVLAGLGVLAGGGAWVLRRRRGVAVLVALAVGTTLAAVVAWQLGELLGPGPTQADLADTGSRVTTSLTLGSLPALAVAPFLAVLVYVVGALLAPSEDLDRPEEAPLPRPDAAGLGAAPPASAVRPLVDVPPAERPRG